MLCGPAGHGCTRRNPDRGSSARPALVAGSFALSASSPSQEKDRQWPRRINLIKSAASAGVSGAGESEMKWVCSSLAASSECTTRLLLAGRRWNGHVQACSLALIRRSLIDQQLELPALLCRPKTRLLAYSGDPRPPTLDWQSVTSPRSGASAERRLGGDSPMCHHTSISRVPS